MKMLEIECVILINGSLLRWQRGKIYYLVVGGIFIFYFCCKYIKVYFFGVEEKWNKIVFV